MDFYHLIPLYKILCISILLLVPVLPAWLLYTKAPEDKILAQGKFAGFQINATGAVAIFIVLFASIYVNMSDILNSIDILPLHDDRIRELTRKVDSLQNAFPWNLQCQVTIKDANGNGPYDTCLRADLIQTSPMAITARSDKRTVSFYVDNDVLKMYNNSYSITLPGGYGSTRVKISPTEVNSVTKTISTEAFVYKNSADPNLQGNAVKTLPVYDTSQGISKLPSTNQ